MTIEWGALLAVAVATIISAAVTVTLMSLGIRLFATPAAGAVAGAARDDETDDVEDSATRPRAATVGGIACFALAGAVVLFGIYLIVPALHG